MTNQEVLRAGGAIPLRKLGFFIWSKEAFHRAFKVGDLIRYGVGGGTGRITAIGAKRFLYKVTRSNGLFDERVGTIEAVHGWGRP